MEQVKENYPEEDAETIASLIDKLKSQGYEIKLSVYKKDRLELRILAKS